MVISDVLIAKLSRLARRLVESSETYRAVEWEALLSVAVIKVMETVERFSDGGAASFDTWAVTVGRNAMLDYLRIIRRQVSVEESWTKNESVKGRMQRWLAIKRQMRGGGSS